MQLLPNTTDVVKIVFYCGNWMANGRGIE